MAASPATINPGQDPTTAAAKAAELPGYQRSQAYLAIASVWAQNNPQAAMDWASQLSNLKDRCDLTLGIFWQWAQDDVNALQPGTYPPKTRVALRAPDPAAPIAAPDGSPSVALGKERER